MTALTEPPPLSGDTGMGELLRLYPGAQRALFSKYHIGGCRSCAFQPGETISQVCERNGGISVEEMIAHIRASHDADLQIQVAPRELADLRVKNPALKLLDVRTREEHEAAAIPGSQLVTQDLIREIVATWSRSGPIILYDHQGGRALDAAAYFIGHGFSEAKCLAGGIDAYSLEVDPAIPRYRVELED